MSAFSWRGPIEAGGTLRIVPVRFVSAQTDRLPSTRGDVQLREIDDRGSLDGDHLVGAAAGLVPGERFELQLQRVGVPLDAPLLLAPGPNAGFSIEEPARGDVPAGDAIRVVLQGSTSVSPPSDHEPHKSRLDVKLSLDGALVTSTRWRPGSFARWSGASRPTS